MLSKDPKMTSYPWELSCLLSVEHVCSYLPEQSAQMLSINPDEQLNPFHYQWLLERGFRRSGYFVYRPHCPHCQRCVSVRIPVADFCPNRSQKRCWQKNHPLIQVTPTPPHFVPEQFALYQRYMAERHHSSEMAEADANSYLDFFTASWLQVDFYEFRLKERLVGVAITDRLPRSLSAVYTFFDPEFQSHGLGTFAILWQIAAAKRLGLSWVYLGYWIAESSKMRYKSNFRPFEALSEDRWLRNS